VAYKKCVDRVAETRCRLVQKVGPEGLLALGSFRLYADVSHVRLRKRTTDGTHTFSAKHSSPHQKYYLCLDHVQMRRPSGCAVVRQGWFSAVPQVTAASRSKFLLFRICAVKLGAGGLAPFPSWIFTLLAGLPSASGRSLDNSANGGVGRHGGVL
jgi:hypothetical protein